MKTLKDLSLADLIALHDNYVFVGHLQAGSRFVILDALQFTAVEHEIEIRISNITFYD